MKISANTTQTNSIFFTNHVHKPDLQQALNFGEKFQGRGIIVVRQSNSSAAPETARQPQVSSGVAF